MQSNIEDFKKTYTFSIETAPNPLLVIDIIALILFMVFRVSFILYNFAGEKINPILGHKKQKNAKNSTLNQGLVI